MPQTVPSLPEAENEIKVGAGLLWVLTPRVHEDLENEVWYLINLEGKPSFLSAGTGLRQI